jgi:hypothetical protein
MKTIYFSHSHHVDYENDFYKPLLESKLSSCYDLILPHGSLYDGVDTREILINSDYLIAEVSYPGTGIGLELGRAESNNVPIICFIKKGFKCSSSVKRSFEVIEYSDSEDMIKKIENIFLK